MRTVQFFEIIAESDTNEGRGPVISIGICFDTKSEALKYVESPAYYREHGVMGVKTSYPEHYVKERNLIVYDSLEEFTQNTDDYKLQQIFSKMNAGDAEFVKKLLKKK